MAKDLPYYRMWVKDFDCNENVRLLNLPEAGLYLFALNHAWNNDGLPESPEDIARALKIPAKEFAKHWPRVSRCFQSDGQGRLRNKRQEQERIDAKETSDRARANVQKRYQKATTVEVSYESGTTRAFGSDSVSDSLLDLNSKPEEKAVTRAREEKSPILVEVSQESRLAAEYAPVIHKRHVNRKCTAKKTGELLERILKRHAKDKQPALIQQIDQNHRSNCESWDWTKDGGQFCPGLDKWLNPSEERYLLGGSEFVPVSRAPASKSDRTMEIFMENMADKMAREGSR